MYQSSEFTQAASDKVQQDADRNRKELLRVQLLQGLYDRLVAMQADLFEYNVAFEWGEYKKSITPWRNGASC